MTYNCLPLKLVSFFAQSQKKGARDLLKLLERILEAQNAECTMDETCSTMSAYVHVANTISEGAVKEAEPLGISPEEPQVETQVLRLCQNLAIRFRVAQTKPGWFTLTSSIARESSNANARLFNKLMTRVWEDLRMMWY